jgi:integral membrane protein (TIGR01906 family)
MMRKVWPAAIQWLLVLILPVCFVILNVWAVTGSWFIRWEYGKAGFPKDPYGFSLEERTRLADVCVEYLATGADISLLADQRLSDGTPAFNERELQHMADVQFVYRRTLTVGAFAAVAWIGGMVALLFGRETRNRAVNALLGGGLFALVLLVVVGAIMALSWWQFFNAFHSVFFEEGTWVFLRSDTLIRLFPERFWMDVAVLVVGFLIAEAIMGTALGWGCRRKGQQDEPSGNE